MHRLFKALGDPHRFAIVKLLLGGDRHVQALADELGITQPAVSRHIRQLEATGLVSAVRDGRKTLVRCPPPDASPEVASILAILSGRRLAALPPPSRAAADGSPASRPRTRVVSDELEDYLL